MWKKVPTSRGWRTPVASLPGMLVAILPMSLPLQAGGGHCDMSAGACWGLRAFLSGRDISLGSEGDVPQDFCPLMFSTHDGEY